MATPLKSEHQREVFICESLEDICLNASQSIARYLSEQGKAKKKVSFALSGGSTPKHLYQHLCREPFKSEIPWNRIHLFWGDERCVSPEDVKSNYRLANETLISHIPIPSENIYRMKGEDPDPTHSALQYETQLRQFFELFSSEWPRFDLILLGIGEDGHTASLFPGDDALEEKKRWVVGVTSEKVEIPRLTLTFPVLNHASNIIFLASGVKKAPVLKDLLLSPDPSSSFPFKNVHPIKGRVSFFLDKAAASQV